MTRKPSTILACILLSGLSLLVCGCPEFVGDQARRNLSSFVTGISSTIINNAINP